MALVRFVLIRVISALDGKITVIKKPIKRKLRKQISSNATIISDRNAATLPYIRRKQVNTSVAISCNSQKSLMYRLLKFIN